MDFGMINAVGFGITIVFIALIYILLFGAKAES